MKKLEGSVPIPPENPETAKTIDNELDRLHSLLSSKDLKLKEWAKARIEILQNGITNRKENSK